MQEQITMNEKIIIDMKRDMDAIINWIVFNNKLRCLWYHIWRRSWTN